MDGHSSGGGVSSSDTELFDQNEWESGSSVASGGEGARAEAHKVAPAAVVAAVLKATARLPAIPPRTTDRFHGDESSGSSTGAGAGAGGASCHAEAAPPTSASQVAIPASVRASGVEMRDYQVQGFRWMVGLHNAGVGGILGDAMGLGKTLQSIAFMAWLVQQRATAPPASRAAAAAKAGGASIPCGRVREGGPVLVVSPLSVARNWLAELRKFAPSLRALGYLGDKAARRAMQDDVRRCVMSQPVAARKDPEFEFDVLVTTYSTVMTDAEFLGRVRWRATIVDEAQRLKNPRSKLFRTLRDGEQYSIGTPVLLTGTPVQNNISELWALLHFAAPSIFSDEEGFVQHFQPNATHLRSNFATAHADTLHELLRPLLLRRTLADVDIELPPMSEVVVHCGLSPLQRKWYRGVLTGHTAELTAGGAATSRGLMNVVMQLRKVCNHPYLFEGAEPEPFVEGDHIWRNSGKLRVLDKVLPHLREEGHRVLLFSAFTSMLDIVQDYLTYRGMSYDRLDGSVRGEERWNAVQRFTAAGSGDDDVFCFLLSTRAGGVGLNLAGADTVVLLDTDWNPQADLQAIARAHRIGQQRHVRVLRLVTSDTIEDVILRRALRKLKLSTSALGGGALSGHGGDKSLLAASGAADGDDEASAGQLVSMVRFGMHALGSAGDDESSAEADDSLDETVEEILARATAVDFLGRQAGAAAEEAGDGEASGAQPPPRDDDNVYLYDGEDWTDKRKRAQQDSSAFDTLMAAAAGATDRPARVVADAADRKRRRSPNVAEDAAVRKRDREDTAQRKAERAAARKAALWEKNGYVSQALPAAPEHHGTALGETGATPASRAKLRYVVGDATKPQQDVVGSGATGKTCACIVLHCVDNSGSWGRGGMFSALDRRDPAVAEAYERAGRNRDLALGSAHLFPLAALPLTPSPGAGGHADAGAHASAAAEAGGGGGSGVAAEGGGTAGAQGSNHMVCLLVCMSRRKGKLTLIEKHLSSGLGSLAAAAREVSASVHSPRIGDNVPSDGGGGWYAIERLLRKHLCTAGVPTAVYYYRRHDRRQARPKLDCGAAAAGGVGAESPPTRDLAWWVRRGEAIAGEAVEEAAKVRSNIEFMYSQDREALSAALKGINASADDLSARVQHAASPAERALLKVQLKMTRFYGGVMSSLLAAGASGRSAVASVESDGGDSRIPSEWRGSDEEWWVKRGVEVLRAHDADDEAAVHELQRNVAYTWQQQAAAVRQALRQVEDTVMALAASATGDDELELARLRFFAELMRYRAATLR